MRRVAGSINPYPLLLREAQPAPDRAKDYTVVLALDLQSVARTDPEGFADGLRQYQPARFIDGQSGIHIWILPLIITVTRCDAVMR